MCNMNYDACRVATPNESLAGGSTDQELEYCDSFLGDFVPVSVSQLSLISRGTDHHEKALDLIFLHFAVKKDSQLPALNELHLSCFHSAENAYKDQCARLLTETEKVGVVLDLMPLPTVTVTWGGE